MPTSFLSQIETNIASLIRLPYSFVTITGLEAEKFLQGQFSCDMKTITAAALHYGTVSSPKGRMYGLFKIIRIEDGFLLRLEPSTVEKFVTTLNKYKVFFKCDIKIASQYASYAYKPLALNDKIDLPSSNQIQRIDADILSRLSQKNDFFELWTTDKTLAAFTTSTHPDHWFALETQLGLPELYEATQDSFILQYLNLQELGAVSFKKGCYTGQEIIARMKFLGKLKKKMFLLSSPIQKTVEAGSDIYDETGKKCGQIVRSHWSEATGSVSLGILNISYADDAKNVFLETEKQAPFVVNQIDYNV